MNISRLYKNGTIKNLVDRGLMSPNVMEYFEYQATFLKYRAAHSYRDSCEFAAIDHGVSTSTIKRALVSLKD